MAEDTPAGKVAPKGNSVSNKSWGTSFILILLTLLVAVACIVALACTLTQTRVTALAIDGVTISIPKLDYVGRQWAAHDTGELNRLDQEELKVKLELALWNSRVNQSDKQFDDNQTLLFYRVQKVMPELAAALDKASPHEQYSRISGYKEDLIAKDSGFKELFTRTDASFSNTRLAADRVSELTVEVIEKSAQLQLARNRFDQLFNYIKPGLDKDKDAKARVENAFYELSIDKFQCGKANNKDCGPIGGLVARGLYHVLTLRPDLLTLCLVILMGILGSTLQITHSYFMKDEKQDIGGYFQRVAVGAMTALVIFIVAKAGIPVIADTSRLGGDAPINPYLISFLAIISGLLSENAIANIQAQGRRYFGADGGGPKRWARQDYAAALEKQSMSTDALAGYLGVDKSTAEAMLKGSASMDSQQQKLFALCLRDDPRSIFTDIAPPAPAAAGT